MKKFVTPTLNDADPLARIWVIAQGVTEHDLVDTIRTDPDLAVRLEALRYLSHEHIVKLVIGDKIVHNFTIDEKLITDSCVLGLINERKGPVELVKMALISCLDEIGDLLTILEAGPVTSLKDKAEEKMNLILKRCEDDQELISLYAKLKNLDAARLILGHFKNETSLVSAALTAEEANLRCAATEKITQKASFQRLMKESTDESVLRKSFEGIGDEEFLVQAAIGANAALFHENYKQDGLPVKLRIHALELIKDEEHLVTIAMAVVSQEIWSPAINKIHGIKHLRLVVSTSRSEKVTSYAQWVIETEILRGFNSKYVTYKTVPTVGLLTDLVQALIKLVNEGWPISGQLPVYYPLQTDPQHLIEQEIEENKNRKVRPNILHTVYCKRQLVRNSISQRFTFYHNGASALHLVLDMASFEIKDRDYMMTYESDFMTSANERFDLKMKYHKQNEQFKLAGLPVKDEYWLNLQVERELEIKKANRLREKKERKHKQEYWNQRLLSEYFSNLASLTSLVLAAGADVNHQDDEGATPLHLAVQLNSKNVSMDYALTHFIGPLLSHGAKTTIKDAEGRTPLEVAELTGWEPKTIRDW